MKKLLNKIGGIFLAFCLTFSCLSLVTYAAEGTLQFSDPNGAAGDTITVTAKVNTGGAPIGDTEITVSYDTSLLKFVNGTNATGENGTVKLSAKGDGVAAESAYSMEFTALKEGTATLQVTNHTAYLYSDESLNLTLGTSQITVQGGTPVTDGDAGENGGDAATGSSQVEVNGKTYSVNENFSEAVIPKGFAVIQAQLDGKTTKAMIQQSSGQYMYYLEDGEGNSNYFLYSSEDGSFTQTEVIDITPELSIFLMNNKDKKGLPSEYKSTTTSIGGKEFTAWQNTSQPAYYLVYALSSEGTKGYYKYDTTEKTYQRYEVPTVEKEQTENSLSNKIFNFIKGNMTLIMCVVWGAFLLLLIVIIILAVKLSHRNHELDDLYDEYGLDDMDNPDELAGKKGSKVKSNAHRNSTDDDDFLEEDYSDDDYDDDDDDFLEEDYSDDDDEYDDMEDYDEKPTPPPVNRKNKNDDDYTVDFIDI